MQEVSAAARLHVELKKGDWRLFPAVLVAAAGQVKLRTPADRGSVAGELRAVHA